MICKEAVILLYQMRAGPTLPFDADSVKSYMSVVAAVTVLRDLPFGKVLSAFVDFFGHCN